jgi:CheY-like chemotaxis protein
MPAKHPPTVLVVEDDRDVRKVVVAILQEGGFQVTSAATGQAGLNAVYRRAYDLIVSGVSLSDDMDGVEMVRCARLRYPALRCLFISGNGEPMVDDAERDGFVPKPFKAYELLGCAWELVFRKVPDLSCKYNVDEAARAMVAAQIAYQRLRWTDSSAALTAGCSRIQ